MKSDKREKVLHGLKNIEMSGNTEFKGHLHLCPGGIKVVDDIVHIGGRNLVIRKTADIDDKDLRILGFQALLYQIPNGRRR